jgi:penicillin-binding protein 2
MPLEFNETQLEKKLNGKIRFFVVLISLVFLFVLFRLGYLQILKGSKYSALSTNNRIRLTRIPGPRGIILSKNNEILVKNTPSFDLNIIPQDTPDIDKVLNDLSVLLTLDKKLLKNKVDNKRGRPPFEPITIKKELSWTEMSLVLSKKMDLGGVCVDVVPKRLYCLGTFASHVFGFLGKIN